MIIDGQNIPITKSAEFVRVGDFFVVSALYQGEPVVSLKHFPALEEAKHFSALKRQLTRDGFLDASGRIHRKKVRALKTSSELSPEYREIDQGLSQEQLFHDLKKFSFSISADIQKDPRVIWLNDTRFFTDSIYGNQTLGIMAAMMHHQDKIKGTTHIGFGSGSGVLEILALKLGAVDILPIERETARVIKTNLDLNQLSRFKNKIQTDDINHLGFLDIQGPVTFNVNLPGFGTMNFRGESTTEFANILFYVARQARLGFYGGGAEKTQAGALDPEISQGFQDYSIRVRPISLGVQNESVWIADRFPVATRLEPVIFPKKLRAENSAKQLIANDGSVIQISGIRAIRVRSDDQHTITIKVSDWGNLKKVLAQYPEIKTFMIEYETDSIIPSSRPIQRGRTSKRLRLSALPTELRGKIIRTVKFSNFGIAVEKQFDKKPEEVVRILREDYGWNSYNGFVEVTYGPTIQKRAEMRGEENQSNNFSGNYKPTLDSSEVMRDSWLGMMMRTTSFNPRTSFSTAKRRSSTADNRSGSGATASATVRNSPRKSSTSAATSPFVNPWSDLGSSFRIFILQWAGKLADLWSNVNMYLNIYLFNYFTYKLLLSPSLFHKNSHALRAEERAEKAERVIQLIDILNRNLNLIQGSFSPDGIHTYQYHDKVALLFRRGRPNPSAIRALKNEDLNRIMKILEDIIQDRIRLGKLSDMRNHHRGDEEALRYLAGKLHLQIPALEDGPDSVPAYENPYFESTAVTRSLATEDDYFDGRLMQELEAKISAARASHRKLKMLVIGAGAGTAVYELIKEYGDVLELTAINKEAIHVFFQDLKASLTHRYPTITDDEVEAFQRQLATSVRIADVNSGLPDDPNASFDLILVSCATLKYIREKHLLLSEIKKKLRKNGVGFISTMNITGAAWGFQISNLKNSEFFDSVNHHEGLTEYELIDFEIPLGDHGFLPILQAGESLIIRNTNPEAAFPPLTPIHTKEIVEKKYGRSVPTSYHVLYEPSSRKETRIFRNTAFFPHHKENENAARSGFRLYNSEEQVSSNDPLKRAEKRTREEILSVFTHPSPIRNPRLQKLAQMPPHVPGNPKVIRALKLDPTPVDQGLLSPLLLGFFTSIRKQIHPESFTKSSLGKKGLSIGGGADITTLVHGLGVQQADILDPTQVSSSKFEQALANWDTIENSEGMAQYLTEKFEQGSSSSKPDHSQNFEIRLVTELKLIGVSKESIRWEMQGEEFSLHFGWSPSGKAEDTLDFDYTWIQGRAEDASKYGSDYDFVLIKAGYEINRNLESLLPLLIPKMRPKAYLLTDDIWASLQGATGLIKKMVSPLPDSIDNRLTAVRLSDEAEDYRQAVAAKLHHTYPDASLEHLLYGWALNLYQRSELRKMSHKDFLIWSQRMKALARRQDRKYPPTSDPLQSEHWEAIEVPSFIQMLAQGTSRAPVILKMRKDIWRQLKFAARGQILSTVSWPAELEKDTKVEGRSLTVSFSREEVLNGQRVRKVEMKGNGFLNEKGLPSPPMMNRHTGFGTRLIVPDTDRFGRFVIQVKAAMPKGGMSLKNAQNESRILLKREALGLSSNTLLGYGERRRDPYRFREEATGMVLRGVPKSNRQRMDQEIIAVYDAVIHTINTLQPGYAQFSDTARQDSWQRLARQQDQDFILHWIQEAVSNHADHQKLKLALQTALDSIRQMVEVYALALRTDHDLGFLHNSPHLNNVFYDELIPEIGDHEATREKSGMSWDEAVNRQIMDIETAHHSLASHPEFIRLRAWFRLIYGEDLLDHFFAAYFYDKAEHPDWPEWNQFTPEMLSAYYLSPESLQIPPSQSESPVVKLFGKIVGDLPKLDPETNISAPLPALVKLTAEDFESHARFMVLHQAFGFDPYHVALQPKAEVNLSVMQPDQAENLSLNPELVFFYLQTAGPKGEEPGFYALHRNHDEAKALEAVWQIRLQREELVLPDTTPLVKSPSASENGHPTPVTPQHSKSDIPVELPNTFLLSTPDGALFKCSFHSIKPGRKNPKKNYRAIYRVQDTKINLHQHKRNGVSVAEITAQAFFSRKKPSYQLEIEIDRATHQLQLWHLTSNLWAWLPVSDRARQMVDLALQPIQGQMLVPPHLRARQISSKGSRPVLWDPIPSQTLMITYDSPPDSQPRSEAGSNKSLRAETRSSFTPVGASPPIVTVTNSDRRQKGHPAHSSSRSEMRSDEPLPSNPVFQKILSDYGLGTFQKSGRMIGGYKNTGYWVQSSKGEFFIKWIRNVTQPTEELSRKEAAINSFVNQEAEQRGYAWRIPRLITKADGKAYIEADGRPYMIYQYAAGDFAVWGEQMGVRLQPTMKMLAELHAVLKNYQGDSVGHEPPDVADDLHQKTRAFESLRDRLSEGPTSAPWVTSFKAIAQDYVATLQKISSEFPRANYARLPRQFIHGDFAPIQIMYAQDGFDPRFVVDWENAIRDLRVVDFVRGIVSLGWPVSDENLVDAVARYQIEAEKIGTRLLDEEIHLVPYFNLLHHLRMSEKLLRADPNNPDLKMNFEIDRARDLISLEKINRQDFLNRVKSREAQLREVTHKPPALAASPSVNLLPIFKANLFHGSNQQGFQVRRISEDQAASPEIQVKTEDGGFGWLVLKSNDSFDARGYSQFQIRLNTSSLKTDPEIVNRRPFIKVEFKKDGKILFSARTPSIQEGDKVYGIPIPENLGEINEITFVFEHAQSSLREIKFQISAMSFSPRSRSEARSDSVHQGTSSGGVDKHSRLVGSSASVASLVVRPRSHSNLVGSSASVASLVVRPKPRSEARRSPLHESSLRTEMRTVEISDSNSKGNFLMTAEMLTNLSPAEKNELFSTLYLHRNELRLVLFGDHKKIPNDPALNAILKLPNTRTVSGNSLADAEKAASPQGTRILFLAQGQNFRSESNQTKAVRLSNQPGEIEFARLLLVNGGFLPGVTEKHGVVEAPSSLLAEIVRSELRYRVVSYAA